MARRRRRSQLRWWLALYAALLGLSTLVRLFVDDAPEVSVGMRATAVPEFRAGTTTGREVPLIYRELGSGAAVLLLHGSPGSSREMVPLAEHLAPARRILIPDLPGFGASRANLADYSFDTHARQMLAWIEELGIEQVHVVGYSMGGGVALRMAEHAPDRVRSIALVSAIGVQEFEWLGNYHMNRALHGLQLGLLWSLRELTPHFGLLDGALLGVPYARNFFDSDQRPLRGALERWEGPLSILHGDDDVLVPLAAAAEHRRIAPHSSLDVFAGKGHFMVFLEPATIAAPLRAFFDAVEAGRAPRLADASAVRRAEAARPFDARTGAPLHGFARYAVLGMLALSTLISEDLACVGAGHLAAQGRISLFEAAGACFVGIYIGDLLLFFAGRLLGRRALRMRPMRWFIDEAAVERSAKWFQSRGLAAIFLSRFMPGTRAPTYFAAGAVGASAWRFALYFALAAGLWTPTLVWIASGLSGELTRNVEYFQDALPLLLLTLVVLVLLLVKVVLPLFTWRGRRLLVGRWRRWRHWEFWPTWLFYPPIIAWIVFQGLVRHRKLTLFTAANPAIPLGGFVDESKRDILAGLDAPERERMRVACWEALPAGLDTAERLGRMRAFAQREGLDWPLVLKPDAGQRGSGVLVAHTEDAARAYLDTTQDDLLVQEFAPGWEYGIFYARLPSEARGRILSITDKRLAHVVGDGKSSVERLILADPRAVAMARYYLAKNGPRLDDVPAAGVKVAIGDLGTHARGAIFLDGAALASPALLDTVDAFSRSYKGFYFGRYDVRVPSPEHLSRGAGLLVLELNGVSSESTSIYDRKHGVLHGWRTLTAQWTLAFEVGAQNRDRGVRVAGLGEVLRAAWRHRARARGRAGG